MFTYFKLEKFVDTLFIVTKTDYFYPRENERSHYGEFIRSRSIKILRKMLGDTILSKLMMTFLN
jgi:hypothetical protein